MQHRRSLRRLPFAERWIGSKKPWQWRGNSCMLVCISSPWCILCSSWWCVDTEGNKEATLCHRSWPIKGRCDALTDFLVELFTFTIAYVDPSIAGQRVDENNTPLFWWHWPGDDELILPIVTSIVDTTIWSVVNAEIGGLPDPSRTIREHWGCREEPNWDGSPYSHSVTQFFDTYTSAGWVKAATKLSNPPDFASFITANMPTAQLVPTRLCLVPAATFLWMTSSHLQQTIWSTISGMNRMMIVRLGTQIQEASQRRKESFKSLYGSFNTGWSDSSDSLKSIRNCALGLFADYEQCHVADDTVAWLCEQDHWWIFPLQAPRAIGIVQPAAQLQISHCEDGMDWLVRCWMICILSAYFPGTLEGGRMGDNLEFFGEVVGLFLVFCVLYYYIIHIHAWRAVLRVYNVGSNHWDVCFWEGHSGSDMTLCKATT